MVEEGNRWLHAVSYAPHLVETESEAETLGLHLLVVLTLQTLGLQLRRLLVRDPLGFRTLVK